MMSDEAYYMRLKELHSNLIKKSKFMPLSNTEKQLLSEAGKEMNRIVEVPAE